MRERETQNTEKSSPFFTCPLCVSLCLFLLFLFAFSLRYPGVFEFKLSHMGATPALLCCVSLFFILLPSLVLCAQAPDIIFILTDDQVPFPFFRTTALFAVALFSFFCFLLSTTPPDIIIISKRKNK